MKAAVKVPIYFFREGSFWEWTTDLDGNVMTENDIFQSTNIASTKADHQWYIDLQDRRDTLHDHTV